MLTELLFSFVVGFFAVIISSEIFIHAAKKLSLIWKISPLIVSIFIIGLGTNLPELTVTISAIAQQDAGLAMGNLIGSCILNITLIFGLSSLLKKVHIGNHKTQRNGAILVGVTLLFTALEYSNVTSINKGLVLIAALLLIIGYQYSMALYGRKHEDKKILKLLKNLSKKEKKHPAGVYYLLILAGVIGLGAGGQILVNAVTNMAQTFNLSTTFLGLTLTAVSTSLPELLLTLIASKEHEDKVVVGTLVGSNLFNLTLFPAFIAFSQLSYDIAPVDMNFLVISACLFVSALFYFKSEDIPKSVSVSSLILFLLFIFMSYNSYV